MTLADSIVVMRAGRVLQQASPRQIYERPESSFVATFVGSPRMNLLRATRDGDVLIAGDFRFDAPAGALGEVDVAFRCEHVVLGDASSASNDASVPGEVTLAEPLGAETHLTISTKAGSIVARFAGFDGPKAGDNVRILVAPERLHFFDPAARSSVQVLGMATPASASRVPFAYMMGVERLNGTQ